MIISSIHSPENIILFFKDLSSSVCACVCVGACRGHKTVSAPPKLRLQVVGCEPPDRCQELNLNFLEEQRVL